MPVFAREGAILPAGQDMQYTGEKPDTLITLFVYQGRDGNFDLYSDEGNGYGYEKGQYCRVPLSYDDAQGKLTIGHRDGSWPGMPERQTFRIVFINRRFAAGIDGVNLPYRVVDYRGKLTEVLATGQ